MMINEQKVDSGLSSPNIGNTIVGGWCGYLKTAIKKFRGVGFSLFSLNLFWFDGYGFNLLNVRWDRKGKMCTMTNNRALLSLNIRHSYDRDGKDLVVSICFLFHRFKNIVKEIIPKKNICDNCSETCPNEDWDKDGKHYCCEWCRD